MLPAKFIGWALDKIPNIFKWGEKEIRKNEVNNIDKAVNTGNNTYINNKLQSIKNKYDRDTKAAS